MRIRFSLRSQTILDNCLKHIIGLWQESDGKTWVVEIKRETRSSKQNRRYWSIINDFAQSYTSGGRTYQADTWHDWFKGEFIGFDELPDGRLVPKSSKVLTVDEYAEFSAKVEVWLVEQGYTIKELD